jgi:peptidyl-prolyl cis-trans isomerase SurA
MTLKKLSISAAFVFGTVLLASPGWAQNLANAPESPYGGSTVEDIVARVNDQIITKSDYDRAMDELDQEGRKNQETMQQMAAQRRELLRNLIDQQLWLSKGKELGITGDTELTKQLDEIRKQYNLESMEDLEKAAKEQGVSFEDFKANIRNKIVTQEVMRQEVGERLQMTPGEVERYYDLHKQEYSQPESERLSEIMISAPADDAAKVAAAKAKADDIETRLHAGGDFTQLAKSFSDGTTAAQGGDLGQYKRGVLPKLLEDKTFDLQTGQYTEPILTRQGYIILKVVQHMPGGPRPFKDVQEQVEQDYYMTKMEPAIRDYLSRMRDEAFIQVKQGYTDSGATYAELHPSIGFSAYVPPAAKKKAKVERTRFRESTHNFRQKGGAAGPAPATAPAPAAADQNAPQSAAPAEQAATTAPAPAADQSAPQNTAPAQEAAAATTPPAPQPAPAAKGKKKKNKNTQEATEKPGKKEKIRFGQAPRETLPTATTNTATENAGALPETASNADQPVNPLEPTAPTRKTRFSERAKEPKNKAAAPGAAGANTNAPDAGEVADRQQQSAPLGINGDTEKNKKKKTASTTADKTRLSQQPKKPADEQKPVQQPTPIPAVQGAPAPADHPDQQPQAQPPSQ